MKYELNNIRIIFKYLYLNLLSSLNANAVRINMTQLIPTKYLNWGITLSDIPKINIGSKIKKKIIKSSFLCFVNWFIKKNGRISIKIIEFFSLKKIMLKLLITSFIKDFKNDNILKLLRFSDDIKDIGPSFKKKEFRMGPNRVNIDKNIRI